jgi:hypothetical protein
MAARIRECFEAGLPLMRSTISSAVKSGKKENPSLSAGASSP